MTLSVTVLRQSWEEMIEDYEEGAFVPKSERDIQCYLYHLCIKNGLAAKIIHADERYGVRGEHRSYTDLVIGIRPDTRLYVEIKWARVTGDAVISRKKINSILKDIQKSGEKESKRRRYLLVMLYKKKGGPPLLRSDLNKRPKSVLRQLEEELRTEGVKVMFSAIEH